MSEISQARASLIRHAAKKRDTGTNFVRTVVCELRFPLLMELGSGNPPKSFVAAVRKNYPQLEHVEEIAVGIGGPGQAAGVHIFRSLTRDWSVSLKQSAVLIEAKRYPGYDKFSERVKEVVAAASPVIDSDFWTRVGLRYINDIPLADTELARLHEKLNPALIQGLSRGVFRGVNQYSGLIVGGMENGGYRLQHELRQEKSSRGTVELGYRVDVDVWRSEIPLADTLDVLDSMHEEAFAIFDWALAPSHA